MEEPREPLTLAVRRANRVGRKRVKWKEID